MSCAIARKAVRRPRCYCKGSLFVYQSSAEVYGLSCGIVEYGSIAASPF